MASDNETTQDYYDRLREAKSSMATADTSPATMRVYFDQDDHLIWTPIRKFSWWEGDEPPDWQKGSARALDLTPEQAQRYLDIFRAFIDLQQEITDARWPGQQRSGWDCSFGILPGDDVDLRAAARGAPSQDE